MAASPMKSHFINIPFRSLLIFLGIFTVSCVRNEVSSDLADNRFDSESVQRLADVREAALQGGGRGYVKTGGWTVPDLTSIEKDAQFKVQGAKTFDGMEVDVEAARYRFEFGHALVSSDIAAVMGLGDLNIQSMNEYKSKDHTFAYMLVANPVELDKASDKIKSSRGVVFYFAIYDEDGDGVFETLAIDEHSVTRLLRPHVPAWAAK